MAKEYIEREEVLKEQKTFTEYDEGGWDAAVRAVPVDAIKNFPAADVVEVKYGRWTLHDDGSGTCDQCNFTQKHIWDDDNWQNYCGVCGADMRERRDNE